MNLAEWKQGLRANFLAFLDLLVMWQPFKTKSKQSEFQKNILGISKNTVTFYDNLIVGISFALTKPRTVRQKAEAFFEKLPDMSQR